MIAVSVAIIIEDTRVLLCQRLRTAKYPLMWEFPGGKLEPGESAVDGLRRELMEELVIDAHVGELYHHQSAVYPDSGTFDVYYYIVPAFSGVPRNNVFESMEWVHIADLGKYDILHGNRDVVKKLMEEHAPKQ